MISTLWAISTHDGLSGIAGFVLEAFSSGLQGYSLVVEDEKIYIAWA